MRKAKWLAVVVAATMLLGMFPALAAADGHENGLPDGCQILYAGQNIPVGTVCVENTEDEICVTYKLDQGKIDEGWVFTELHLHFATSKEGLPTNRTGNPVPGHFEHKAYFDIDDGETEHTFKMGLADIGEDGVEAGDMVYIAAHAVVEKPEVTATDSGTIVSDTNTLVFDGEAWVPSILTWVHPSWPAIPGAYWIWESEYALNPRTGDVLQFMREFSIPGTPTSGSLVINTDNECAATLNAVVVGGDNNWATVETYNVLSVLTPGPNTLVIDAVNWPWDTDSSTVNPGGVIYKLSYDYEYVVEEHQKESAWADGDRFVNRGNWATFFCHEIVNCKVVNLIPRFEMFPGYTYANSFSRLYADAAGAVTSSGNTLSFEAWGLTPHQEYRVYFDTDGVTPGDVSTADGPWHVRGTFTANEYGVGTWSTDGTWNNEAMSTGSYTISVFINRGFPEMGEWSATVLVSYNVVFDFVEP